MLQIEQNLYSLVCIQLFQRFKGKLGLGQCRRRWPNINPALIECCILLPEMCILYYAQAKGPNCLLALYGSIHMFYLFKSIPMFTDIR